MKKKNLAAVFCLSIAALFAGCQSESLTESGEAKADPSLIERTVTLNVGEHKDIELPIAVNPTYAVSSATTSRVSKDINLTNSRNVSYSIAYVSHAARPVLRLIGAKGGIEAVSVQLADNSSGRVSTLRVIANVIPNGDNNDVVGGSPCSGSDCGGGGGGGGGNIDPPNPPGPVDPGDKPIVDPDACTTAGFYYVEDSYQDVEGKFSPDFAAYIRSLMSGNVDSLIRLYYPNKYPTPVNITYSNLGRFLVNLKVDDKTVTVEFDLQLSQHLFGQDKKYFYIETNGYCLRGNIPASFMTPPDKSLVWVTRS